MLLQQFSLLGGPPDENSPRNLCRYRAPIPGRLASFSKMTFMPENASIEEFPPPPESEVEHSTEYPDIFIDYQESPLSAKQPEGLESILEIPQNDARKPEMTDCANWIASRCLHNHSRYATRGGSSTRVNLSSDGGTVVDHASKGVRLGIFRRCASHSRRYWSQKRKGSSISYRTLEMPNRYKGNRARRIQMKILRSHRRD